MKTTFPDIKDIAYEGPRSKNPLAFKHYNADVAADYGGCLRRRGGDSQGERRRSLRCGLTGALVLAIAVRRESEHQRPHRAVRDAEPSRNGDAAEGRGRHISQDARNSG